MSSVELSPPPDTPTTPAIVRRAAQQQQQEEGAGRAGERLQALLGSPVGERMEVDPVEMPPVPAVEVTVPGPTATPARGGKATAAPKPMTTERIPRPLVDGLSSSSESSSSDEDEPTDAPLFDDALPQTESSVPLKISINPKQPLFLDLPSAGEPGGEQPPQREVYTYPPSCVPLKYLAENTQQIKLARFLKCRTEGCACDGLRPPGYTTGPEHTDAEEKNEASRIVLWINPSSTPAPEGIEHLDSSAQGITTERLWDHCGACGCGWLAGGANVDAGGGHTIPTAASGEEAVDKDELQRRRRVAHRAEEMLEVCFPLVLQKR
jgi:hypothetical protein